MLKSTRQSMMALLLGLLTLNNGQAEKNILAPPDDPRQSINYWKSHTLSAKQDKAVAQAHEVFSVLLRAWDGSRLEPGLYVVDSTAGPWAASLADGNILLSRNAIDLCMAYGRHKGEHLLAFVLAHELAHQRADDLWHQRFFRMLGRQSPKNQNRLMQGLNLDAGQIEQLEQKEAQADHDGLILMSSVGYDPHQVLNEQDFFTTWVENIWNSSCRNVDSAMLEKACKQAQSRALRAQVQLAAVASQAMLYELGIQAFVARQYQQARHYFTLFGRDYPSRAVISALAISYLAQAAEIQQSLIAEGDLDQPGFYYPLMLDASVLAQAQTTSTRRGMSARGQKLKQQMTRLIQQGAKQLERAIELEPDHRKSYLMLATAYLLDNNSYMVRGVLQGRYIPRFGKDASVQLLLAMTRAIEGQLAQAKGEFQVLLKQLKNKDDHDGLTENLLRYTAYYNAAAIDRFRGDESAAHAVWQQLAKRAQASGNALLFRLALGQLRPDPAVNKQRLSRAPAVNGMRLGDQYRLNHSPEQSRELWIEGEKYRVLSTRTGSYYIASEQGKIISAWQESMGDLEGLLVIGDAPDRPLKALGMPDRHLHMQTGEYLAYDQYGLALHINQNKLQGWFLY